MKDDDMRKAFGNRLKTMRKQRRWTQKELAAMLDIGLSQFNKYESGMHIPPIEKLIQLSELFDTPSGTYYRTAIRALKCRLDLRVDCMTGIPDWLGSGIGIMIRK